MKKTLSLFGETVSVASWRLHSFSTTRTTSERGTRHYTSDTAHDIVVTLSDGRVIRLQRPNKGPRDDCPTSIERARFDEPRLRRFCLCSYADGTQEPTAIRVSDSADARKGNTPPKSSGRPPTHGVSEMHKKAIVNAWGKGEYTTYKQLRAGLNLVGKVSMESVRKIIDSDRQAKKRAIVKTRQ